MSTFTPEPDGEALRQSAVYASGVLGLRGNARLRAIVEQTAALLDLPVAAISIIDRDRQWFPAIYGADLDETTREVSFCAHTILTPGKTTVVPDAREDPRFAENAMVTGDPFVRFYIGAPLVTRDGAALGALCAIDDKPHDPPSAETQAALRALADEATAEIEKLEHARAASPDAIAAIVKQIQDAAAAGDEALLLALDRVLRRVEGFADGI